MRRPVAAAAVVLLAASVPAGTAAAKHRKPKPKAKTVEIHDNYFAPAKLTVKTGQKVTWKWPMDIGDTHDVTSKSVPKGAQKFAAPPYAVGAKYSHTFTKAGKYSLVCTFHRTEMTMTVEVTKP